MDTPGIHAIDVKGQSSRGPGQRSWTNKRECDAIVELLAILKDSDSGRGYGVVTPFRAQADLVSEQLELKDLSSDVRVGTAHSFQGDERDVMIFSPVVAPGILELSARWTEEPPNLINVAVSRAREAFYMVGHFQHCRKQKGILGKLARYCETVELLRKASLAELELFGWMSMEGWSPNVHQQVGDIEVDFVLRDGATRIAVEVDGGQHRTSKEQDAARNAYLVARGYDVRRFSARSVFETPAQVIHEIRIALDGPN